MKPIPLIIWLLVAVAMASAFAWGFSVVVVPMIFEIVELIQWNVR